MPVRILTDEHIGALLQYLESGPDPDFLVNQVIEIPPATAEFIREHSDA